MTSGGANGWLKPTLIAATVSFLFCGGGCAVLTMFAGTDSGTDVPDYTVESGNAPQDLRVIVDYLPTRGEAVSIIEDLQRRFDDRDDGYFVRINCATGGTATVDNRLANGKFAVGAIGAARTGLPDGAYEVEMVDGRRCPD